MRILTSKHYIAQFTVPAQPGHTIRRTRFVNLGRLCSPALALAAYSPLQSFEVAHFVNHIPLALSQPWLVTFESALPRMFPPGGPLWRHLRNQLCSPRCLAAVAMSHWALATFRRIHADWSGLDQVLCKTLVLPPALPRQTSTPRTLKAGETIQLVFVGNNFARKGGIVALRVAQQALREGLPLRIHIVSSKMICSGSHTDHPDAARYETDLKALGLPNVTFHGALGNREVLALMRTCHLSLLATLHDTYGFSVLEGFANGLPAIATDVCALPEFVIPAPPTQANGFLLRLPKDKRNCWRHVEEANTPGYWDTLDRTFHSLTSQVLEVVRSLADAPASLEPLSCNALASIDQRHNPILLARTLDAIYCQKPVEIREAATA